MSTEKKAVKQHIEKERVEILEQLEGWMQKPMILLGFMWLALLIAQLVWGLHPFLRDLGLLIWAVFVMDFILRFIIAPRKLVFVKRNWLTLLALVVPAFSMFQLPRVLALLPSSEVTMVSILASFNRGMRALADAMGRRGLGYAMALTVIVTLLGAAGMLAFERSPSGSAGINTYGYAVWWTAMIMTTLGSDYFPHTGAGRLLCFLLAVYAFSIFGYITASIATFFINRDAGDEDAEVVGTQDIRKLEAEIAALRNDIQTLSELMRKS